MTRRHDGPGEEDVFTLLAMLERDLNLRVRVEASPRRVTTDAGYWALTLVLEPATPAESIWSPYTPLLVESEWNPRTGRTWAAHLWHQLFLTYSLDLPSDWPTRPVVAQLPLGGA